MTDSNMNSNIDILKNSNNAVLWIQVGTLFDGTSKEVSNNAHIVFDNNEILFVGAEGELPPESLIVDNQLIKIDLSAYTMLPGLIDAHAHIFLEGAERNFEKRKTFISQSKEGLLTAALERIQKIIPTGVTGFRDAGDKDNVGLQMAALYKTKIKRLPYIESPGAAIHREGRYGRFMGRALEQFDSVEACVQDRIDRGADRIKLIPTGIINFKKGTASAPPQMDVELLKEFVAISKKHNKQTFAHASGNLGIQHVIDAGIDSIEHGFFISSDQLSMMRDKNIAWVPTFAPVQKQVDFADEIGWDQQITSNLKTILENHAKSLLEASKKGVKIIAGSDAGSVGVAHGLGFLYELELMENAGMQSLDIINAATGISYDRLCYFEKIGKIAKGYKPRMIFTKHNVLESVKALQKEKYTYFDGALLEFNNNTDITGL